MAANNNRIPGEGPAEPGAVRVVNIIDVIQRN
jgi:hypothetical protein